MFNPIPSFTVPCKIGFGRGPCACRHTSYWKFSRPERNASGNDVEICRCTYPLSRSLARYDIPPKHLPLTAAVLVSGDPWICDTSDHGPR